MGYKVLLRASNHEYLAQLEGLFEEEPLTLVFPEDLDWSNAEILGDFLAKKSPHIVVNYMPCDSDNERQVIENITQLCQSHSIPLLHFSSYRVFGKGPQEEAVGEESEPAPRDELGKRLLSIEHMCARVEKHLIVRLSWLLDGGSESVLGMLVPELLCPTGDLCVSDHDQGFPVSTGFIAHATLALAQQILCGAENWGVFHLRSSDMCSEAEVCDALVRLLSSDLDKHVQMPVVAGVDDDRRLLEGEARLVGERCTNNFGIQLPSWRKGLKLLVKNYLIQNNYLSE